uniref:hypothetical protein n=1 Tax=Psychrobacter sp. DAB_AL43B TaxID=1028416 RepID=UPI000259F7CA|nr:hypothetical protein [Psychrobacter sp. DAB_AL43B]AFH75082.1 hypothetical protein [Psychrobacter sp. DAB_AL43B]
MKMKLPLLIVSLFFLVACSSSDDTSNVQPTQELSDTNDIEPELEETASNMVPEVEESAPKAELTPIPMSDSFENGRYFLTSQMTENDAENIEYIRKGNDNTSYAKMQIKCSNNEIRKYSADNADALRSANMGDWITPTPDGTDQDIVNFICK